MTLRESQLARSFQATAQPTPSFQATTQVAPSVQVTSQADHPISIVRQWSIHHWAIDAIDLQVDCKRLKLRTSEVLNLSRGECIVVLFDYLEQPIAEAQGVLAGLCGLLAADCSVFPISSDKWPDLPKSYFNHCFDNIIKPRFCFMTPEPIARRYVYHSIRKNWAASRKKLWDEFNNPLKRKDEIIDNVPIGIARDQWTSFVNYRAKEAAQTMCKRNAEKSEEANNSTHRWRQT